MPSCNEWICAICKDFRVMSVQEPLKSIGITCSDTIS